MKAGQVSEKLFVLCTAATDPGRFPFGLYEIHTGF
jgi:hypothetical protein